MGRRKQAPLPTQAAAFSIHRFAPAHHLSELFYYKMRDEGWGPDEMQVGKRVLISFEVRRALARRPRTAGPAAGAANMIARR